MISIIVLSILAGLWVGSTIAGVFATSNRIIVEPRDICIGVFWDRREDGLHVYVCPVPCIVQHMVFK